MSASYITDSEGNIVYPKTLAKCVNKGGSTLEEYLNDVEDATLIKPTVSGTDMVLTDSSDMNIQELHVYGRTEQESTTGCQMIKINPNQSLIINGITFTTDEKGIIHAKGTATANADLSIYTSGKLMGNIYDKEAQIITLSNEKKYTLMTSKNVTTIIISDNSPNYSVIAASKMETYKINNPSNNIRLKLRVAQNETVNCDIPLMIYEGTDAKNYEPYTGGQPSPNPEYTQEMSCIKNPTISVAGKNLLKAYIYSAADYKGGVLISNKYPMKGDTYYTLSGNFGNSTYYINEYIETTKKMQALTGKTSITFKTVKNIPFTSKKSTPLLKRSVASKEIPTDLMLVEGKTAEEYEEYTEQTAQLTCELNGIDEVKDELIVRADGTGQMIQRTKLYDCSQISRNLGVDPNNKYYYLAAIDKNTTNASRVLSTHFTSKTFDEKWGNVFKVNGSFYFGKKEAPDNISDTNLMKQWLIDNKVKILFKLEEPIVTELSAEEVQKVLALHTNKQNSTIWNDQNADMQITYVADAKNYIDKKFTELENSISSTASITALEDCETE